MTKGARVAEIGSGLSWEFEWAAEAGWKMENGIWKRLAGRRLASFLAATSRFDALCLLTAPYLWKSTSPDRLDGK